MEDGVEEGGDAGHRVCAVPEVYDDTPPFVAIWPKSHGKVLISSDPYPGVLARNGRSRRDQPGTSGKANDIK